MTLNTPLSKIQPQDPKLQTKPYTDIHENLLRYTNLNLPLSKFQPQDPNLKTKPYTNIH